MDWFSVAGWILRLGMIPLVAYRRRLTSALSWLAVIFLVPWVGVPLYVLFAEHRMTRRVRRHARVEEGVRSESHLEFQKAHLAEARPGYGYPLSALNRELGGFALLDGNRMEILEGSIAISRLVEEIDGAEDHVHLLFYVIEDDRIGTAVCNALEAAARRGVRCRVLADAVGSYAFHRRIAPGLRKTGVEVRKVLPFDLLLKRFRPLDLRNHRKLAVVDGEVAFTGSMNLVDENQQSGGEYTPWRDLLVRLEGPVVQQLQLVFHEDWEYNTGTPLGDETLRSPRKTGPVKAQAVPSGPTARVEVMHTLMVAAIHTADEGVVITTPYLILDEPTAVALHLAALRGVQVDIIVPSISDSTFVTVASHSYYEELLDEGVRIHEHRSGFLHAKTLRVDRDFAMIGSANFDRRSFYLNFELNLILMDEEAVDRVARLQERYLKDSRAVDREKWKERGMTRRIAEDMARLLSPLL